jgi:hypothetical protein
MQFFFLNNTRLTTTHSSKLYPGKVSCRYALTFSHFSSYFGMYSGRRLGGEAGLWEKNVAKLVRGARGKGALPDAPQVFVLLRYGAVMRPSKGCGGRLLIRATKECCSFSVLRDCRMFVLRLLAGVGMPFIYWGCDSKAGCRSCLGRTISRSCEWIHKFGSCHANEMQALKGFTAYLPAKQGLRKSSLGVLKTVRTNHNGASANHNWLTIPSYPCHILRHF